VDQEDARVRDTCAADQSGHTGHAVVPLETADYAVDPEGVDRDVVVGIGHIGAAGGREPTVARTGEPRPRLADVVEPGVGCCQGLHDPSRRIVGRCVVDDDHLKVRIGQLLQARQAVRQGRTPVPCADHHRDELARPDRGRTVSGREPRPGGRRELRNRRKAILQEVRIDGHVELLPSQP